MNYNCNFSPRREKRIAHIKTILAFLAVIGWIVLTGIQF